MGTTVAVMRLKESEVVEDFRRAGALSAATAQSLEEVGIAENLTVRRLCKRAVIREGSPGLFYVDEEVWRALRSTRKRMALLLLGSLLLITVGVGFALLSIR